MSVESRAAISRLYRQLAGAGIDSLTNPDHLVFRVRGVTWRAVYRHDGTPSLDYVWDVFPGRDDPGPGRYRGQIAEALRTTEEVVELMRNERDTDE